MSLIHLLSDYISSLITIFFFWILPIPIHVSCIIGTLGAFINVYNYSTFVSDLCNHNSTLFAFFDNLAFLMVYMTRTLNIENYLGIILSLIWICCVLRSVYKWGLSSILSISNGTLNNAGIILMNFSICVFVSKALPFFDESRIVSSVVLPISSTLSYSLYNLGY